MEVTTIRRFLAPLGLVVLFSKSSTEAARLTGLGVLPANSPASYATAVTPDGAYVAGYAKSGAGTEAFLWSKSEGLKALGDLPGGEFRSEAHAISADGSIVVGVASSPGLAFGLEPFRWSATDGLKRLGSGLPEGSPGANARAMTRDGRVVVGGLPTKSGPSQAYFWTAKDEYRWIDRLPEGASDSVAAAVSADGRVLAGSWYLPESGGFRWTAETGAVGLGRQINGQTVQSEVYGMSADGRFITGLVVYEQSGNLEMMRWSQDEGLRALGHFPKGESRSIGYGISDDGQTVVGEAVMEVIEPGIPFPQRLPRAAVWRQGVGLRPLWDLLIEAGVNPGADGWTSLFVANAVSGDGRFVVGSGRRNGRIEAYLADLGQGIEFKRVENGLRLVWPEGFKVQTAQALVGDPWNDLPEAASPWVAPIDAAVRYFRIVRVR